MVYFIDNQRITPPRMIFFENTPASLCTEYVVFCRKRHFFMKNILLVQKKILPLQTFCIVHAIRVRKRASFLGKYGRNGKFDFFLRS